MAAAVNMMTAFTFIVIILVSGSARLYFKHKFNVATHINDVGNAVNKLHNAKEGLQHAKNK